MQISFLSDGKIHKENLHNISENNNIGYMVFNIGEIKILTILAKKDNNYFYIKDPHDSGLEILTNNKNYTHIYHFINTCDYNSNNLFPEIIFKNIKKIYNVNDDTISYSSNTLLLNLITYYDKHSGKIKKNIITLMENLSELMDTSGEFSDKLNYLQIKKRIDKISEDDKTLLLSMLKHDNIEIKFAASVLLEDRENANKYFNSMINDEQEFYKKLPIYKLYRQL